MCFPPHIYQDYSRIPNKTDVNRTSKTKKKTKKIIKFANETYILAK